MSLNTLGVLTITAHGFDQKRNKRRRIVLAKLSRIKLEDAEEFSLRSRGLFNTLGRDEMDAIGVDADSYYVEFVHRMFDRHL